MDSNEVKLLKDKCKHIRRLIVDEISNAGSGHIGGSLSIVEALVVLYYRQMNINPSDPQMPGRYGFVLSKGHAGPALYAVLADRGYFDVSELKTLNKPGTKLPSHCDMLKTRGVDMTAGSLGQGLSCAAGMAKGSKIKNDNAYIYCIIGDGESQEGAIWEAAMAASHYRLNNLIAFTDSNKLQIEGNVEDIMGIQPLSEKWKAFGWNVMSIDGHDLQQINDAVSNAKECKDRPTMIILNTIKGKGLSFIEALGAANHHMPITKEQLQLALKELE